MDTTNKPTAIEITLYAYTIDDLRGAYADLIVLGKPIIIQLDESQYLCICHYSKDQNFLALNLDKIPEHIKTNMFVAVCYPATVKRIYGLNTLGNWDVRTKSILTKNNNGDAVIILQPTETE